MIEKAQTIDTAMGSRVAARIDDEDLGVAWWEVATVISCATTRTADGTRWVRVRCDSGREGWAWIDTLQPASAPAGTVHPAGIAQAGGNSSPAAALICTSQVTGLAGRKLALPGWFAVMLQSPVAPLSVMVSPKAPDALHTPLVVNVTGPEFA